MYKFIFILIFTIGLGAQIHAQVFKGVITDSTGQPIPFSTVFVKELSFGTAANIDGGFELMLTKGTYTFVFQCMGYKSVTKNIAIDKAVVTQHIVLQNIAYTLSEVTITSDAEDPAYKIMRNVISRAPLYANLINSYKADVYIRGSMEIEEIASLVKLLARNEMKEQNIKEGDKYLEESVNEIEFRSPNIVRQKVKSIHSSFPGNNTNNSSGAIGYISQNLYQPGFFGTAKSPLTAGAFAYYRYHYEGEFKAGEYTVDKIKVIPKGDGPQYVSGYLFIIEGLWCIYSLDFTVNAQLGTTIQVVQSFAEVKPGIWLSMNNHFKLKIDMAAGKSTINYHTSVKYNAIDINQAAYRSTVNLADAQLQNKAGLSAKARKSTQKADKKINKLSQNGKMTNKDADRIAGLLNKKKEIAIKDSLKNDHSFVETYKTTFDSAAFRHDSVYWNSIRPIPLTINEEKSINKLDSTLLVRRNTSDTSKVKKAGNKKLAKVLLTGGNYEPDSTILFRSSGFIYPKGIQYNLVDGLVVKTNYYWQKKPGNGKQYSVRFTPGYAFTRGAFLWDSQIDYTNTKKYRQSFGLKYGSDSKDFNTRGAMALENTVYTLFLRENLSRLYLNHYLNAYFYQQLSHELNVQVAVTAEQNNVCDNNTDYSFFYRDTKTFKLNSDGIPPESMANHRNLQFVISISYKPSPFYYVKDGYKVARPGLNKAPTFNLFYAKGLPVAGFDTDFDLLKLKVNQNVSTGRRSSFSYVAEGGYFLNTSNIYFNQFKHFETQPLIVGIKNLYPSFQSVDYYSNSTDSWFVSAHAKYQTQMLLLKRLPFIRNRLWDESLMTNFLYTPEMGSVLELGYSIGNELYNVGGFVGFDAHGFKASGLRISLSIFSSNQIAISL